MGTSRPQTGGSTPDGTPEITVFSIKVEKEQLRRFREACDSMYRKAPQEIRRFMDQTIREHESNGEAA